MPQATPAIQNQLSGASNGEANLLLRAWAKPPDSALIVSCGGAAQGTSAVEARILDRMNEPSVIFDMLGGAERASRTLAVVGLSDDPRKPSHSVSAYMQRAGYRIRPVNPGVEHVLGERCYPSLRDLPQKPDVVNVFRLPRFLPGIVEEMIALGLRDLWVQLGILNVEAARQAEEAGIRVVMDRCILIEHQRLFRA